MNKKTRLLRWGIAFLAIAILWAVFPPFRFVKLDSKGQVALEGSGAPAHFDEKAFVDVFWTETFVTGFAKAQEIEPLLEALTKDPLTARERFGHKVGVGSTVYYFVRGTGTVVERKGRRAILEVDGERVSILIAPPVFGNTVRDASGLLSVNMVPGLEEFNALSTVLNAKVETDVLPLVDAAATLGARIDFVACSKAPETLKEDAALDLIPLQVGVAP